MLVGLHGLGQNGSGLQFRVASLGETDVRGVRL